MAKKEQQKIERNKNWLASLDLRTCRINAWRRIREDKSEWLGFSIGTRDEQGNMNYVNRFRNELPEHPEVDNMLRQLDAKYPKLARPALQIF